MLEHFSRPDGTNEGQGQPKTLIKLVWWDGLFTWSQCQAQQIIFNGCKIKKKKSDCCLGGYSVTVIKLTSWHVFFWRHHRYEWRWPGWCDCVVKAQGPPSVVTRLIHCQVFFSVSVILIWFFSGIRPVLFCSAWRLRSDTKTHQWTVFNLLGPTYTHFLLLSAR